MVTLCSGKESLCHAAHVTRLAETLITKCSPFSYIGLTLSQTTNLRLFSSKLKDFADDNFEFDENSRKLFQRVEKIVGKGEIARYKQFLLFPQCFQKTSITDT